VFSGVHILYRILNCKFSGGVGSCALVIILIKFDGEEVRDLVVSEEVS